MERCQALALALKDKPLQILVLSGNDCGAEGAKAAWLRSGFKSKIAEHFSSSSYEKNA